MTIGEKIKQARISKKMTQEELAEKLGYKSRSSINKIEKGERDIPRSQIKKIADILEVSPISLLGFDDELTLESPEEKLKSQSIPYEPEKMIPVPVVGKVAAGYTCLAQMDIETYELVDAETILDGYEYMWLRVKGDSMEPKIEEGDLVLVRLQETVSDKDYAVVIVDEEDGLVKQVRFNSKSITLISINPYYPPREFKGKEMQRVRIVGKVIESKRKF